jgi:hypothetical protein
MRRTLTALALLLVAQLAQGQATAETPAASDTVTFELLMDIEYDDSATSLTAVRDFLAFGLSESVAAPTRDALEHHLFDRYEFGPSQLPKTFAVLREQVGILNSKRKPGEEWLIPALPRRRATKRDPKNPYHSLPRVATYEYIRALEHGFEVVQRGDTEDNMRAGSKYTLVQVSISRDLYKTIPQSIKETAIFRGLTSQLAPIHMPQAHVRTNPARLAPPPENERFAAVVSSERSTRIVTSAVSGIASQTAASAAPEPPQVAYAPVPTPPQQGGPKRISFRDFLDKGGYAPPAQRAKVSYLLVMDDGWPSLDAMNDSYKFFEDRINSRRARYRLGKIELSKAPANPPFANHASQVDLAIKELRKTDNDKRVRVLYVPVVLNAGTERFAREILKTGWLIRQGEPQRLLAPTMEPLEKPSDDYADFAIAEWKQRIASARKAGQTCRPAGVPAAQAKPTDCFHTDAFLLNTIYKLAEAFVEEEDTIFVVNQSWTVNGDTLELFPTPRSMTVSATGDDGLDVIKDKVDFARQSLTSDTYVAVMFLDGTFAPDCGSGTIGADSDKFAFNARAVAFDGDLDNGYCGTSFASPRVAWLIAAKANPGSNSPSPDWQTRVQQLIRNSRYGGNNLWRDIYFYPMRFWQNPLP